MNDRNVKGSRRLERLWAGEFGDAYTGRNRGFGHDRGLFWEPILAEFPVGSVLEVGCNIGLNLVSILARNGRSQAFGIDLNHGALMELRAALPEVHAVEGTGRMLPFADASFDLVFTMGVLIHQAPDAIDGVMKEVVRCSRRYILCCEYYASEVIEVPYRGQRGALYKRDFGARYLELHPTLALRATGTPVPGAFPDERMYWVFEKPV